jgi:competence protein ComEC
MEQSLLSNMRYGGIAHVFAVSGLHVGALYAFCRMLIQRSPLSQAPKAVCFFTLAALLLFYGGVCGYSASVVRAIVVCLAYDIGIRSGFQSDSLENMGLAAIVLLCLSPVALFTVGFQLSFTASLGIILLSNNIYALLERGKETLVHVCTGKAPAPVSPFENKPPLGVRGRIVRSVLSFLSVTLSAQIATAPLTLYVFGYLSVWSLLLNCLFVPILSVIFSAMLTLVVIACILPLAFSSVVLYLPSVVWSALLLVFQIFDLSANLIQNVSLHRNLLVVYYTALLFCTDKWNISKKLKTTLVGICFAAFLLGIIFLNA